MTTTLNPTITITVSGPTGSGKSRVLVVIADVLKLIHGDCIIEAPDVKAEKEMCGNDYTAWHKPRSGTVFRLEEINQPIKTGRCMATPIIAEDLYDRPVPVHIQALMSKLGISFEEYQETDLQPVVDLVNWALTTPSVLEQKQQPDEQHDQRTIPFTPEGTVRRVAGLVDQQIKGSIDPVTARAIWYNVTKDGDVTRLANHLAFALNCAVDRCHHKIMARGINTHGIPEALPEQERQAENISHIYISVISQLYGKTDMVRAYKFWQKTLEEMKDDRSLLVEILIQAIADINNQQDMAQ
ncbi:hypothetical protein L1O59_002770 [Salmonella enterica]|uniref:hypothetical protein n=1 Tax=Salmonella enterica TaxID=28901 RepID=UPI0012760456|nr:hypothetical protein [Salmonella enterica]EBQ9004283.1 hypothetical protein [Salmonella enterica subsp. enterica serovar Blockley]EBW2603688.1 hypothetical protein [Salmonella enterica subsp. enterica serovar Poano]EBY7079423.1 hypothetical protein [Salmonella enterica subsp. enterica serovar Ealing]ECD6161097.1 hypothetical protein [Salmonella enterica subsp. enterica]ECU7994855.1 hypothetical protein [Salmonella enterica subsp. enterica serovar Toucra]EDT7530664.1 hypothetical protein [S